MNIFVLVAAAAMALASCQTQEMEDPTPKEYEYIFEIGNADEEDAPETSATLGDTCVEWESGDELGSFTKTSNGYSAVTVSDGKASFSVYSSGGLDVGQALYFYYPRVVGSDMTADAVSMSIPVSQDGDDDMPLASLPYIVTEASGANQTIYAGKVKFANLGSVIEFHVYSETDEYQTEKIQSVTFNADQEIAGDFVFDLTSVDYSNEETLEISGYTEKSVVATLATPVAVPATRETAKVVKLVVAPGSYTGNIVVATDKATYTYPITSAKNFQRSVVMPLGLNLREEKRTVITTQNHTIQWDSASEWTESRTKLISGEYTVNTAKSGGQTAPTVNDNNNDCRVYAKGTVTVSYSSGNMQRLVFNLSEQGKKRLAEITPSVGNVSVDNENWTVTWEGNSKSVVFTVGDKSIYGTDGSEKAGQLCFNSIDVVSEVASTPSDGTLVDLEITGMTTMFVVGSEFVFDGKAYAVYSDDEKKDVTNSVNAILSDGDMSVVGSKTVTITYVEDDVTVSSEYLITVSENVADYSGTYAIVAFRNSESYYYYLTNEDDGANTKRLKALVAGTNKPEDNISLSATKLWNVAKSGNAYTLQSVDSEMFVSWSSGNSALMAEEGLALTVEKTEDKYTFKYVVSEDEIRYLSLNSSKGSNYFAMYEGSQSQELYLIPAVEGEEVQPTVVSIEITDYITSFTQGDTFDFGGKVIATLSNGVKVDVTESATFSGYNMETVDVQTITVTYEGKTQTYDITVIEKTTGEETFEWVATESADLKDGDQVVIVSTKGSDIYAMSNNNGTGSAPAAVAVKYSNDKLSSEPEAKLVWTVEISGSNYIFYPGSDNSKWLYCTATNNGLRVGTNTNKTFVWDSSNYLKNNGTNRYIGVYNNQDWRCYTSTSTNISGQTFKFFVRTVGSSGGETPDPEPDPEPEPEPDPEPDQPGSTIILSEEFDNSTSADSSSDLGTLANGVGSKFPNFISASKAYTSQFGGLKFGSSSAAGSITTKSLDLSKPFRVTMKVKGWTKVEGNIKITCGSQSKTLTYTAVSSGNYETISADFEAATSTSQVTIATTSKRAYIDDVVIEYIN